MNYRTQNGRTSKKGAFLSGIWHCDCEPRVPADKFQTKNGGKNHGRWFYTCHKPQPKRCSFFLWQDDAKIREESPVSNNSRSEPGHVPQTPRKFIPNAQVPITPQSKVRPLSGEKAIDLTNTPIGKSANRTLVNADLFERKSSDEAELAEAAAQATMASPFETPRKAPRIDKLISSDKRSHGQMQGSGAPTWPISTSSDDDVFVTPTTSNCSAGLLSPAATPIQNSLQFENQSRPIANDWRSSSLATEALKILAPIQLNSTIETQLVALLNSHALRTQGIAKGRDITRLAIQSRDRKIAKLQERIAALEAERETSRTVIAHLKQDIGLNMLSPMKGRGCFASCNDSPGKT